MEETLKDVEDIKSTSSNSSSDESDVSEASTSGNNDELHLEEPLTEKEVEDLIAEFLDVESKAAEAQETLEKESLAQVEAEVRQELGKKFHGDELEAAVADEMNTFREEWEAALDDLETESANLLEQLDGAGIELPSLYRMIESQAPNGCCTEAWKKMAHWVGAQATGELRESISNAEKYLQIHRPVRRRHGKIQEEGASGYLQKKLASDGSKKIVAESSEVEWGSLNQILSDGASKEDTNFGSKDWAAVYLASTPQQAAMMGLKFPGVEEVEEIDDIDGSASDPFVKAAIENEKDLVLSEEQKKNFRKVKEEEDANIDRKLQLRLKRRRQRKRCKRIPWKEASSVGEEDKCKEHMALNDHSDDELDGRNDTQGEDAPNDLTSNNKGSHGAPNLDNEKSPSDGELSVLSGSVADDYNEPRVLKRSNVFEEQSAANKKSRTVDADGIDETHPVSMLQNQSVSRYCTACGKVAVEVHAHPVLKVIICKSCKKLIEETMSKDSDFSECYCVWCGGNNELVYCKSCTVSFCTICITRNIGEQCLSEVQASGWQCCCCSPSLIQELNLEFEKALDSGDLVASNSESDSDTSDSDSDTSDSDSDNSNVDVRTAMGNKRRQKKKIRRIIDDAELGEETKRKIAIEKERQEHLNSLKVQFSAKSFTSGNRILPEDASTEVLGDSSTGYIVNVVREKGEESVRIPPSISAKLKAHQVAGIRFMWENIVQSISKVKSGDKGLGCILAHTMGLGKTLQVIAFLYAAMRCVDLGLRTALIVTPVNVLHNWRHEFLKWRPSEVKPLRVFMLEDVTRERRSELLAKWRTKGGVFLIGYAAFRNLSLGRHMKDRHVAREICCALQDGPDILVCDEAHMIKNTRADTTQALKQIKCQRRIALTGSPLQNNLMEYYCMVDFVREGFLGSSHEFRNRFQNPIENGQHTNSTSVDVKIMNQRSHILYEQLKGFVQRMDMSVVKKDLPPKTVYVVAVKLSPLQRKLYKRFLDVHGFTNDKVSAEGVRKSFFAGYQALAQIWNHPGILQLRREERDCVKRVDTADNFPGDDSSSDEIVDDTVVLGDKSRNGGGGFFRKDWWNDLLVENDYKELEYSGKMVLLLDILTASSNVGDKALVFSQSIPTLDLIELYLSKLSRSSKRGKFWKKDKDWYRLDGRTESSERQRLVEKFNDHGNKRVKCVLISTRAGSLGINLHAANRVVIVDGSWNPTYDLQAIYRAWRYGQTKPVFAYRLMAHGTMEEKIYKRQVNKEGLAARVVDKQQVHRTISREEMLHLFEFGDEEILDMSCDVGQDVACHNGDSLKHKVPISTGSCSSDKLMESLLSKHYPRWIANYHEHETLLQENEEEKLSKEEQDMAWEVYLKSLEWEEVQRAPVDSVSDPKTVVPNVNHHAQLSASPQENHPSQPSASPYENRPAVPSAQALIERLNSQVPPSQMFRPRSRYRKFPLPRKCTILSHLLTLRSQGTKMGCTTICGECAEEISWETSNRKGKTS